MSDPNWDTLPAAASEIQFWGLIDTFRKAIERRLMAGLNTKHFRQAAIFAHGTIGSITRESNGDILISVAESGWNWSYPVDPGPYPRQFPDSYDVQIDSDDPQRVVRMHLSDFGAGWVRGSGMNQAHPESLDLSNYVGREFFIITGYGFYLSPMWSERIPQWPNVWAKDTGTITAVTTDSAGNAVVTFDGKLWTPGQYAEECHLVISDNYNTRLVISANTADTIIISGTSAALVVGRMAAIVGSDQYYDWLREGFNAVHAPYMYRWADMRGPFNLTQMYSRDWNGYPAGALMIVPSYNYHYSNHDEFTTYTVYPMSGEDSVVGCPWKGDVLPDEFLTPCRYRTIRGFQEKIEELVPVFIDPMDWSGMSNLTNLTRADVLPNQHTVTTSTSGSVVSIGAFAPYLPIFCHWSIWDSVAGTIASGTATADIDGALDLGTAISDGTNTRTVKIAFGWTRKVPYEFIHWFDCKSFVPDYLPPAGSPTGDYSIWAPPTNERPGKWQTRPASSRARFSDEFGYVFDSSFDYDDLVEGKLYRYAGDNFHDASIRYPSGLIPGGVYGEGMKEFFNAFCEGVDDRHKFGDAGAVFEGAEYYARCKGDDLNWWKQDSVTPWLMKEHTGICDIGSSTTMLIPAADSSFEPGFWNDPTNGRWLGWVIEINLGDDTSPDWHRRVVTAHDPDTYQLEWAQALPSTCEGKAYRIREPWTNQPNVWLNRWKDRTITFGKPDGTTISAVIRASDDEYVFFDSLDEPVQAGWSWEIDEPTPGGTWLRQSGTWVKPPTPTYPDDQLSIPPDFYIRYGRYTKGDYSSMTLFSEMKGALQRLSAIVHTCDWVNPAYPASSGAPNNVFLLDPSYDVEGTMDTYADYLSNFADWANGLFVPGTDTPQSYYESYFTMANGVRPRCWSLGNYLTAMPVDSSNWTGTQYYDMITPVTSAAVSRGRINVLNNYISAVTVDFYNYAKVQYTHDPAAPAGTYDPQLTVTVIDLDSDPTHLRSEVTQVAFNNYGNVTGVSTSAVQFQKWTKWSTASGTADNSDIITPDVLGGDNTHAGSRLHLYPTPVPDYPSVPYHEAFSDGFEVTAEQAIVKFDMGDYA